MPGKLIFEDFIKYILFRKFTLVPKGRSQIIVVEFETQIRFLTTANHRLTTINFRLTTINYH